MDYSLLGPTGVKVSKVCLGTATFGVAPDAQEAERVVHAALDLGINFDTANVYGRRPSTGLARRQPPNANPQSRSWAARSPVGATTW
jgi:aryl-alcohol dehydrogenase-like predicted oxidoreductase